MIELRDTVTINVPPSVLWDWLQSMPDHYREWHPHHLSARWVHGAALASGAVMEVRERLHGKPHRLRMKVIEVQPGKLVRYRVFPGVSGAFFVRAVKGGVAFTAVMTIGTPVPLIGPVIDKLLCWPLGRRIEAIGRHQAEEGANLKALLEKGTAAGVP